MEMATNPFAAAHDLLRQHEPNTILFNDADDGPTGWAEAAFHSALSGQIPGDLLASNDNTPLLHWSDPDTPALGLLDAAINPPTHRAAHCDRCRKPIGVSVHRLWVPGGQSTVEMQFCSLCFGVLNDVYRDGDDGLGPEHRLLVWG